MFIAKKFFVINNKPAILKIKQLILRTTTQLKRLIIIKIFEPQKMIHGKIRAKTQYYKIKIHVTKNIGVTQLLGKYLY